jgi:hypothetical protein
MLLTLNSHSHSRRHDTTESSSVPSSEDRKMEEAAAAAGVGATASAHHHNKLQKKNSVMRKNSPPLISETAGANMVDQTSHHGQQLTPTHDATTQSHGWAARNLPPRNPGDPSAASIASIKSGVIGNPRPQEDHSPIGGLPNIKSTNGKFMESGIDRTAEYALPSFSRLHQAR